MLDVRKLYKYNQYLRHRYLETLGKLPWDDVVKDRGASFGSLRNIYLHSIACVEFICHLLHGDPRFPRIKYEEYESIEKIKDYVDRVESTFNPYLQKMTTDELSRRIERTYRDGSTSTATVEDYLLMLVLEETHHRGEFIALLWQMDIAPPHLGWTRYLHMTAQNRRSLSCSK